MKHSVDKLAESLNGNNESFDTRIENRLLCNLYHCYKYFDVVNSYAPEYHPFDCYHCYHGDCLENWKMFHLRKNNGVAKQIKCLSYCCSVRDVFDNLYACGWKFDGPGVQLPAESMIEIVILEDSEDIEENDTPNWREQ